MARLIWAVDLHENPRAQRRMLDFLQLWTRGDLSSVEPVYVSRGGGLWPGLEEQHTGRDLDAFYLKMAGRERAKLAPLRVLQAEDGSLRARVGALLAYAQKAKAPAVALTTHARTGFSHLAYGSFTEAAVLRARLPLLTLNPDAAPSKALRKIVFATDLSAASDAALDLAATEAKARGAALVLAHCAEFDRAHPEAAYGTFEGYADARERYLEGAREKLMEKAARARRRGAEVEEAFIPSTRDLAGAIVAEAAARKAQLIAMASRAGALDAALGGSVTRKVVRSAHCAVWSIHAD